MGRWPNSFDAYADATGRLMAHCRPAKGFLFASTISVYDPPGGDTPVPESHPFGFHTTSAYSFTKVANEAVISYLSRRLDIPKTIIGVGRVPPLVANWCGDDVVTVEDYCTYLGELVGRQPIFEYTTKAWCSLVPDTTLMHEVLGHCEVSWRDGCRTLVEQRYPELLC
jgi:UDP-glucuronate 4-epimerase